MRRLVDLVTGWRQPRTGAAEDIEPARALLHPIWVLNLGLLVLNDHVLKGSGLLPGWATGKLSDLAGLVVAPVLLAALVRARTRPAIAVVHAVVGAGFAALEMSSSLTAAADAIYRVAGLSWRSTRDVTDLLALAVLPLAYLFTVRAGRSSPQSVGDQARVRGEHARCIHPRTAAVRLLGAAGLLACTASNGVLVEQPPPCGGGDCDLDGYLPPEDCNDYNPDLTPLQGCPAPGGEDACDDGVDNDGDSTIDCDDIDCDLACEDLHGACSLATQYVSFDQATVLSGSTLTGTSVTEGSCVGADSPEVIFQGSTAAGTLTLGVPAGHAIHVRSDCPDAYTERACIEGAGAGGDVLELEVSGPLTIVVEAIDPFQAGPFEVPLSFSPVGCGDGVRSTAEHCDDGNHASGDGCSAGCEAEPAVLCDAMPVIAPGQTTSAFMNTSRSFIGPCIGSLDSPEKGFRYTATSTSVTVTVDSTGDVGLYATLGCGDEAISLGCADAVAGAGQETLTLATRPGDDVTFFVELAAGEPESATLTLDVTEP